MRLLLIGCTGLIGRELVPQLLNASHELTIVGRTFKQWLRKKTSTKSFTFIQLNPADPENWSKKILIDALGQAEGVINLAGEPIAEKRWTASHQEILLKSRLNTTRSLVNAIKQLPKPPKVLVNASAVGYYGTSLTKNYTEESSSGEDFLSNLCKSWEFEALQKPRQTRLLILRIGIVLAKDGGALGKMLPIFRTGFGGPLGNGQQWMSWIHRTDICQLITLGLEKKEWSGVVNAVAPKPVLMTEFSSALGRCLHRPSLLPVPAIIIKLLLGDGAKVVLQGQRVSSKRLTKFGYKFKYGDLNTALSVECQTIKPKNSSQELFLR